MSETRSFPPADFSNLEVPETGLLDSLVSTTYSQQHDKTLQPPCPPPRSRHRILVILGSLAGLVIIGLMVLAGFEPLENTTENPSVRETANLDGPENPSLPNPDHFQDRALASLPKEHLHPAFPKGLPGGPLKTPSYPFKDGSILQLRNGNRPTAIPGSLIYNYVGVVTVIPTLLSAFQFSLDDRYIAVHSLANAIQVLERSQWVAEPNAPLEDRVVLNHRDWVYDVGFHPEGTMLATSDGLNTRGGENPEGRGRVYFWDVATGEAIGNPLEFPNRVRRVVFSPDGRWLVIASSNAQPPGVKQGTNITYATEDAVHLIDVETKELRDPPLKHSGEIHIVEFSADGKLLLTAGVTDPAAKVWDVATGTLYGTPFSSRSGVCDAAFGPATIRGTPTIVAAYRDGSIVRWDAKTGRPLITYESPRKRPHLLLIAITPDGRRLVTADTSGIGMVRFWDLASGELVAPPVLLPDGAGSIAISPNGRLTFAGYSQSKGQYYSTETGKPIGPELQGLAFPPTAVKFSHDGQVLAVVGQGGVKLWNVP